VRALCVARWNEGEGVALYLWILSTLCIAGHSVALCPLCRVGFRCMHAACARLVRLGQGACDSLPRSEAGRRMQGV
jgi:hypothetical protein